jgi:hypothetical protein
MKLAAGFLVAVICSGVLAIGPARRTLTFEERVEAQEAIERVYHRHQIGASSSFEAAVPRAALETKVRKYLDETAALAEYWKSPVTEEMLQRELERIARDSRMPERLLELYAALGNDSFLIKECLARATLVNRLARDFDASDATLHADARGARLSLQQESVAVASTKAPLPLPDERSLLAPGVWTPTSTPEGLSPRSSHTAVWTGNVMIVWGGLGDSNGDTSYLDTGERYDPTTDSWTPTSTTGAPSGRYLHTAVWTGSRMIIWGGFAGDVFPAVGGRYDPLTDSWTPISTTSMPTPRWRHTAVWTGNVMVVWGGDDDGGVISNTGGRYDPVSDSWTPTSLSGAPAARYYQSAVWTGSVMVVWGGYGGNTRLNTGGRYNPATNSWAATSTSGAPSGRTAHTATWTGNVMVVFGGQDAGFASLSSGGRYDPVTNLWTAVTNANAPQGRYLHTAVWTGSLVVVWGGYGSSFLNTGGKYDPASNVWTPTSLVDVPSIRYVHSAIWTGNAMVVWGGVGFGLLNTGGLYAPSASIDHDGDGYGFGDGDCDDNNAAVYPGAPQVCDGINNDCNDPTWPAARPGDVNADGDGFPVCLGDCDDSRSSVYPGAPQLCDGINNDCGDPSWPAVPANEFDGDGDAFRACADCNDADPNVHPGAAETCNGIDDNCDGQIDEDSLGVDSDGDGIPNACDPCMDLDLDGYAYQDGCGMPKDCNDADPAVHPGAAETCDGSDNDCDGAVDGIPACPGTCPSPGAAIAAPRVSTATFTYGKPTLAWTGETFGVAWIQPDGPATGIYFAQVDSDGVRIGPDVRVFSTVCATSLSLAWNGVEYALAWSECYPDSPILFGRFSASGVPLSTPQAASSSVGGRTPSLVWTGHDYAVAWEGTSDSNQVVMLARFDRLGAPIAPALQLTDESLPSRYPALVSTGSGFGVSWSRIDYDTYHSDVYLARLDAAGARLGPDVLVASGNGDTAESTLVWTGDRFAVAWETYDQRLFARYQLGLSRFDAAGAPVGEPYVVTSSALHPSLSWTGVEFGLFWIDHRRTPGEAYLTRLSRDGVAVGSEIHVTFDAGTSEGATGLWNGTEFGLTWGSSGARFVPISCACSTDADGDGVSACSDCNDGDPSVFPGAPELCDGKADNCTSSTWPVVPPNELDADGDGRSACAGDCNDADAAIHPGAPDACGGVDYDCSGQPFDGDYDVDSDGVNPCQGDCDDSNSDIHPGAVEQCNWRDDDCDGLIDGLSCNAACDVDAKIGANVRLTPTPAFSRLPDRSPAIAWGGSWFGVTWQEGRDGDTGLEYFQAVDKFGRRQAGPVLLGGTATNSAKQSSVVWNGSEFAVAWLPNWQTVAFARIRPDGSAVGSTEPYWQAEPKVSEPSLVWTGTGYGLAVRDNFRIGTAFARIDIHGNSVGVPLVVSRDPGDAPSLAWTGTNFAIAWTDHRDGNAEIYFARIDTSGHKIGADVRITNTSIESTRPKLAWNGTEFGLVWFDSAHYFMRLDSNGAALAPPKPIVPSPGLADLVWTGTEYRLAGAAGAVRLDPFGDPKGPLAALTALRSAWTGDVSGIVWMSNIAGRSEILFTRWGSTCVDGDGDGVASSEDCNDTNQSVFPGARELCDGVENDCRRTTWPLVPPQEAKCRPTRVPLPHQE